MHWLKFSEQEEIVSEEFFERFSQFLLHTGYGFILVHVQDELKEMQDKLKTAQREVSRLKSSLNTSRAEIEAARNDGASAAKFNEQELRHAAESKLAVAQQTLQRQTTFITDLKQRVGSNLPLFFSTVIPA